MQNFLRRLLPGFVRGWLRQAFPFRWFRGDYPAWTAARRASAGYDDRAILTRVLAATREVKAGRALWERDGVTFTQPAVNAPLLGVLRGIAAGAGGRLDLVDFGGSLGSTWWQHRAELAALAGVDWRVVEQPAFVAAGRKEFANGVLGFFATAAEACQDHRPSTLLLSSVLQYLEAPRSLLADDLLAHGFEHVVVDRTPFARDGRERLVVQHTPPALGGGSYPCWVFDRRQMASWFAERYDLVAEWPGFDDVDPRVEFRGFHYRRKPHAGGH